MNHDHGTILEIQQNLHGTRQAVIHWPTGKIPLPGQYLQAFNPIDQEAPVGVSLFPGGLPEPGLPDQTWTTAPSIPSSWNPADKILLRGPLGTGFSIPDGAARVALAAFGEFAAFLLPVAGNILAQGGEVALFTDSPFPQLPASIEVNPLSTLGDGIRWADYLAGCTDIQKVTETRTMLRNAEAPQYTEMLILSPMPCGALAACGVCAFRAGSGKTQLVCEDGPVFPWRDF